MNQDDDAMDQFQQLEEEYLTYLPNPDTFKNSTSSDNARTLKSHEKQKLKMIPEKQINYNLLDGFDQSKRTKRIHESSGKILGVGDAIFRSNFQSGNINSVKKVSPHHYHITLEKQTNANRVSAWFYFVCQGLKGQIKFTIKGFTKSSSLFSKGMKVCYREMQEGSKWKRGCSKISYQYLENDIQNEEGQYALNFSFFFKNQSPSSVQFAYCFPYTLNNLLSFLTEKQDKMKIQSLGNSFEGRQILSLTIGNVNSDKVIIISSRVHPGETVGSLMMQGFIKQLLSNSQKSEILRDNFLFKIVPMINPDGVVHGNYRFSGAGYDLNRKWKNCSKQIHSQVFSLKSMIQEMAEQKEVLMYIDLHGHSRQKNTFFYGCCPRSKDDQENKKKAKAFPFLMSKLHSGISYNSCSYEVQKSKQGTARVSMWKYLKIPYVYTLEASFCGTDKANYLISDYESIGGSLCEAICLNFWEHCPEFQNQLKEQFSNLMEEFYLNPKLQEIECFGNSSDSEPEAGQLEEGSRKQIKKIIRPKKNIINKFKIQSKNQKNKSIGVVVLQKNKNDDSLTSKINHHTQYSLKKDKQSRPRKQPQSIFLKTEMLPIIPADVSEKIKNLLDTKRFADESRVSFNKMQSQMKEKMNFKKKTISFEGAQYRRVRKLVEENSKSKDIVGLSNHSFKQIEKVNPKQVNFTTIFPGTQMKFRKGNSNEIKYKKQRIFEQQYRRTIFQTSDRNVICSGKQIF